MRLRLYYRLPHTAKLGHGPCEEERQLDLAQKRARFTMNRYATKIVVKGTIEQVIEANTALIAGGARLRGMEELI